MLLGFKKQFAPLVLAGLRGEPAGKRQTIRAQRKDGQTPRPGDTASLYTGLRTKECVKLGTALIHAVEEIKIIDHGNVLVDGHQLTFLELDAMAERDGFKFSTEFVDWFRDVHGLPFRGYVIKWGGNPMDMSKLHVNPEAK